MVATTRRLMRAALYSVTIFAVLLSLGAPVLAKMPKIGVVSAARSSVHVITPGVGVRKLKAGDHLQIGKWIATGPRGQLHLLFADGSALSAGPRSLLRLDTFSYDAKTKQGAMAFSVGQGQLRFVGGRISKNNPVIFKSIGATARIQGGMGLLNFDPPLLTVDLLKQIKITPSVGAFSQVLSNIQNPNQTPGKSNPFDGQIIAMALSANSIKPGQVAGEDGAAAGRAKDGETVQSLIASGNYIAGIQKQSDEDRITAAKIFFSNQTGKFVRGPVKPAPKTSKGADSGFIRTPLPNPFIDIQNILFPN